MGPALDKGNPVVELWNHGNGYTLMLTNHVKLIGLFAVDFVKKR